jgi:hypothetical protein
MLSCGKILTLIVCLNEIHLFRGFAFSYSVITCLYVFIGSILDSDKFGFVIFCPFIERAHCLMNTYWNRLYLPMSHNNSCDMIWYVILLFCNYLEVYQLFFNKNLVSNLSFYLVYELIWNIPLYINENFQWKCFLQSKILNITLNFFVLLQFFSFYDRPNPISILYLLFIIYLKKIKILYNILRLNCNKNCNEISNFIILN